MSLFPKDTRLRYTDGAPAKSGDRFSSLQYTSAQTALAVFLCALFSAFMAGWVGRAYALPVSLCSGLLTLPSPSPLTEEHAHE